MSTFVQRVLVAVAPVFSVTASVAVVQAAGLPFPIALSVEALPEWAIFCSLVYTSTALLLFLVNRMFGKAEEGGPPPAKSVA